MNKAVSDYFSLPEKDLPDIIDLRGLEAPEPMEQILLACTNMRPDAAYLARLPHVPNPLFPLLETRGLKWQIHEDEDGSALLLIRRRT
jgi:hypothetical protein